MAQIKVTNAQYPLVFNVEITAADVGQEVVIDVQPGFILTGGAFVTRQGFNGTTPTASVVDNKSSPTTIVASGSIAAPAVASVAAGALYAEYPSGGKLRILAIGTGVTSGRADFVVQGIVRGRQNERIGANIPT
jgi:hypothetical protein